MCLRHTLRPVSTAMWPELQSGWLRIQSTIGWVVSAFRGSVSKNGRSLRAYCGNQFMATSSDSTWNNLVQEVKQLQGNINGRAERKLWENPKWQRIWKKSTVLCKGLDTSSQSLLKRNRELLFMDEKNTNKIYSNCSMCNCSGSRPNPLSAMPSGNYETWVWKYSWSNGVF